MRNDNVLFVGGEPISDTRAEALVMYDAVSDDIEQQITEKETRIRKYLTWAGLVAVAGILLTVFGFFRPWSLLIVGAGILGMVGSVLYFRDSEPSVRVSSVSKGYWTGHRVTDDAGTYLLDATETVPPTTYEFSLLRDPKQITRARDNLNSLADLPIVQTAQTHPEEDFSQQIAEIQQRIDDSETYRLDVPTVDKEPTVESIRSLAERASADPVDTSAQSLSASEARTNVEKMGEFEEMVDEDHGESVLQDITELNTSIADDLTGLQETAVDLLNDHVQTAGDMFGMKTYNFYCKNCAEADVESQLEYEPSNDVWHCDTCRTDFDMGQGIPRHKIRDDIVLDTLDLLWVEKDDERRRVYERIEDQKSELEEKEFEEKQRIIRNSTDRIKDLRQEVQDLNMEAKSKRGALDEVGDLMSKYDRLQKERVDQFRNDVRQAYNQIDRETEEILRETRATEQERIDQAQEEAEQQATMMREEEKAMKREELALLTHKDVEDVNECLDILSEGKGDFE